MEKRKVELVVISDVHLGTYGSRASELVHYLKTIHPSKLILNGDIIDIWQFSKHYFPESHLRVLKTIISLMELGTEVIYITGNHDEMLRKFKGLTLGNFRIENKVVLTLSTGRAWIFHGDVFDTTMKNSKWLAKLGGKGYDLLIIINTMMNWISQRLGRDRVSFSKKIKDSVKGIIKYVNDFENTAAEIAIENNYQYVVCGHIHQPKIREIRSKNNKKVTYLNSGDWVENLTALEYSNREWKLFEYQRDMKDKQSSTTTEKRIQNIELNYNFLIEELLTNN
jgi:UDP-2,3-diacylglucosamine pyrophosphatase LpxH